VGQTEIRIVIWDSPKTFAPAGCGDAVAKARSSKSFLVLFFKKAPLACLTRLNVNQPR
jgi:hypothetical protein